MNIKLIVLIPFKDTKINIQNWTKHVRGAKIRQNLVWTQGRILRVLILVSWSIFNPILVCLSVCTLKKATPFFFFLTIKQTPSLRLAHTLSNTFIPIDSHEHVTLPAVFHSIFKHMMVLLIFLLFAPSPCLDMHIKIDPFFFSG